jgi:RHS repeat-associated protein
VFTAAYDAENRLRSLVYTNGSGVVCSNQYVYSGNWFQAQVKEYQNGALSNDTRYVRSGYLPVQERSLTNTVTREYAWGINMGGGIGGLLNLAQGGQVYSYFYDGKGNVMTLLDGTQTTVASYAYDAFGNLMAVSGALTQPVGFSTKSYDQKTGLSYFGFRFYSPMLGRWFNRDPLGEFADVNLYSFVRNSPMNRRDPFGLADTSNTGQCKISNAQGQQLDDPKYKDLLDEFKGDLLEAKYGNPDSAGFYADQAQRVLDQIKSQYPGAMANATVGVDVDLQNAIAEYNNLKLEFGAENPQNGGNLPVVTPPSRSSPRRVPYEGNGELGY